MEDKKQNDLKSQVFNVLKSGEWLNVREILKRLNFLPNQKSKVNRILYDGKDKEFSRRETSSAKPEWSLKEIKFIEDIPDDEGNQVVKYVFLDADNCHILRELFQYNTKDCIICAIVSSNYNNFEPGLENYFIFEKMDKKFDGLVNQKVIMKMGDI